MDQNGFVFLDGTLYEVEYCFRSRILCIKYDLILQVEPLEGQIHNTFAVPVVGDLLARAIDNVRYFIGDNKFLILNDITRILLVKWDIKVKENKIKKDSQLLLESLIEID